VPIHRHHLEIYDAKDYHSKKKAGQPWFVGNQLLLNYCYGHANSSLLLFPYSPVINYINHHPKAYNAKLQWSQRFNKEELLDKTPEELMLYEKSGLVLEVVATRDIKPSEEIYLHYGDNYEENWSSFQQHFWEHRYGWGGEYRSSLDFIPDQTDYTVPIRAPHTPESPSYPPNILTVCFVPEYEDIENNPDVTLIEDDNNDNVTTYQAPWIFRPHNMMDDLDYAHGCEILERHDTSQTTYPSVMAELPHYTVSIEFENEEIGKTKMVFKDVPRRAINLFDDEHTSDLTNLHANDRTFRHVIELPSEIVPKHWMDLM